MIPEGGQNVFEVVISGIENFQVEVMGEHGRFVFPLIATFVIFIFFSNVMGSNPGFFLPHRHYQHDPGLCLDRFLSPPTLSG